MYRKNRARRRLLEKVHEPQEDLVRRGDDAAHPDPDPHVGNLEVVRNLVDAAELLGGALQQPDVQFGHRDPRPLSDRDRPCEIVASR
jgi:hypothetical protein